MSRTVKVVKVNREEIACDICDHVFTSMDCRTACSLCHKDLCGKCATIDNDDGLEEDYCPSCWNIGQPYREKRDEMREQHDLAIEAVLEEWNVAFLDAKKSGDLARVGAELDEASESGNDAR